MIVNRGIDRVNIGDFVQKATILKPQITRNKRGASQQTWEPVADVYGKLVINVADEAMLDQNIINQDRIEFTTYVRGEVSAEYRLEIEGILYGVTSVARLLNQPLMVVRAERIAER